MRGASACFWRRRLTFSEELNNKEGSPRSAILLPPPETLISVSANHFLNGNEKQKAPGPASSLLGLLPPIQAG